MEKMENYDSPRNNVTKNKKGSPELEVEIIETIPVDHVKPTPRSPTPSTVPTEPGLSQILVQKLNYHLRQHRLY